MWIKAIVTNYDAIAKMVKEKRGLDISKESGKLNKFVLLKNGPATAWNSIKPEVRFKQALDEMRALKSPPDLIADIGAIYQILVNKDYKNLSW